jgi:RND family efflux transporter MFP subunit
MNKAFCHHDNRDVKKVNARNSQGRKRGACRWPFAVFCARFAAVGIVVVLGGGCSKPVVPKPEKSLVRVVEAVPVDLAASHGAVSYIALVKADEETDLGFKVGGIVQKIGPETGKDWDEGTSVLAGTVLAELKQADFTNALVSARASADLAQKVHDRFSKLRLKDAISQQELDVTEANWRSAEAQLAQAEQNLRESRIVAPSDGAVLMRYVNSQTTAAPGQRMLRIARAGLMSVELGLPDRLIHCVSVGDSVDVEVTALEGRPAFKGRVTEVGIAASPEGRLYRVVIKVPNPDGLLRSGMTARIQIAEKPVLQTPGVVVPLSALITVAPNTADSASQGRTNTSSELAVFVVQNGKALRRVVKTGDILNSSIVISDGLKVGERVVTAGASFLHDGAPVDVAPETK